MAQNFLYPSTLNLACTLPASQQGNASTASLSVASRSKFVLDSQRLYKSGNVLRSRGSSIKRPRLLAVAELQEAATAAEQQFAQPSSSSVVESLSLSPKIQTLDSSHVFPDNLQDAPSSMMGSGGTAISPGIVESAGTGSDVLQGAGESVGIPAELTPLQRYEALINRANGGGGAREPLAVEENVIPFSFSDSIETAEESVLRTMTDIQDVIHDWIASADATTRNVFENMNMALKGSVDSVTGSIMGSVDSVTGSIMGSVNSVTGLYEKPLDDIQTAVGSSFWKADLTSIFRSGTPPNNQLKEVVVVVSGTTVAILEATGKVLTAIYGTAKVALPTEVQSSLRVAEQGAQAVSEPIWSFLHQAHDVLMEVERAVGVDPENPIIPVILTVGGTLYLGVSFWQGRYGGYSGDLIPSSAFDVLKGGNAVLVDIRPQDLRESEGIPDLRRGMRTRFFAVETITVDGSLRSRLNNAKEIDSILTSSVIRNLKAVSPGTKVILMDNDGSQSKEIARALGRFGVRGRYRVEGGYRAWAAAGLRTKLECRDNPISMLQEDAAEIVDAINPTSGGVALFALGLGAGVYAAFEWEKTLQLLGVIGIGQAIYNRAKSYESLEDLKADLRLLQKPSQSLGDGFLWAVGQAKRGTSQLATSASTSAVQDRVLQAAAKHGPLASELVEDSESDAAADVQTPPEPTAPTSTAELGPEHSPSSTAFD